MKNIHSLKVENYESKIYYENDTYLINKSIYSKYKPNFIWIINPNSNFILKIDSKNFKLSDSLVKQIALFSDSDIYWEDVNGLYWEYFSDWAGYDNKNIVVVRLNYKNENIYIKSNLKY